MSPFIPSPSIRPTDRVIARSVFLILLAVFTATFSGHPASLRGEADYQMTSALARTGRFALGGTTEARWLAEHADRADVPVRLAEGQAQVTLDPGHALVGVPFHATGRLLHALLPWVETAQRENPTEQFHRSEYFEHLLVGWRNALFAALIGGLLVLTSRRLGVSPISAWIAGLSFGCTTFAWTAARSSLSQVQVALLLFLAFYLLVRLREEFSRLCRPTPAALLGLGGALGLALLTDVGVLPAVLVLDVALVVILRRGCSRLGHWRASAGHARVPGPVATFGWALLPQLVAVALWFGANLVRFGEPLGAVPLDYGMPAAAWAPLRLLVAPGGGLLWCAPALVLLVQGVRVSRRRGSLPWVAFALAVGASTLVEAVLRRPRPGVWTFGPRELFNVLPFLWLGVAFGLDRARESLGRRTVAGALLVFGLLVQLPAVLVDHATYRDLTLQAAATAWPETSPGGQPDEAEVRRRASWDWGFASPWAHWRILRHRLAGLGEEYPVRDVFGVDADTVVTPRRERDRGFRHLAWVDLSERLGGVVWPAIAIVGVLLAAGLHLALRGLGQRGG